MRIGFVVEGSNEDAGDVHAVKALCARFVAIHGVQRDPIVVAGGSKPDIINDAHKHVASLRSSGCARIVLLWDNCPPWSGNLNQDQFDCGMAIRRSLKSNGVSPQGVVLVCSRREIEAWILTDDAVIRDVLGSVGRGIMPGIRGSNSPDAIANPKDTLHDWWYQRCNRPPFGSEYASMFEGARINKLRRSKSFRRLEFKVK